MGLVENLKASKDAIAATRDAVSVGAATNPQHVAKALASNVQLDQGVIDRLRVEIKACQADENHGETFADIVEKIAVRSKMGNCGELAYVALNNLKWGVQSVSAATILQSGSGHKVAKPASFLNPLLGPSFHEFQGLNHSFVVVGWESPLQHLQLSPAKAPDDWRDDVVICDPWYAEKGVAFQAQDARLWSEWFRETARITRTLSRDEIAGKIFVVNITAKLSLL